MPQRPLDELREYAVALFAHWQAVILGFAFSFGLTIMPSLLGWNVPRWVWGAALPLALLPASFLAWRIERRRVEAIEVTKPSAKLRIEGRSIAVRNTGAFGTFWAQLRILKHENFEKIEAVSRLKTYPGFWEGTRSDKADIANEHEETLLIGSLGSSSHLDQMILVLYYWDRLDHRHKEIPQAYWPDSANKPSLTVEVTISAKPEIRGGAVVRKYALTTEGPLTEVG